MVGGRAKAVPEAFWLITVIPLHSGAAFRQLQSTYREKLLFLPSQPTVCVVAVLLEFLQNN